MVRSFSNVDITNRHVLIQEYGKVHENQNGSFQKVNSTRIVSADQHKGFIFENHICHIGKDEQV